MIGKIVRSSGWAAFAQTCLTEDERKAVAACANDEFAVQFSIKRVLERQERKTNKAGQFIPAKDEKERK